MSNHSSIASKIVLARATLSGESGRAAAKRAGVHQDTAFRTLSALADKCSDLLRGLAVHPDCHQLERAGDLHMALALDRATLLVTGYGVGRVPEEAVASAGASATSGGHFVQFPRIKRNQARSQAFVKNIVALWCCYWNFCRSGAGAAEVTTVAVPMTVDVIDALERRRAESGQAVSFVVDRALRHELGVSDAGSTALATPAVRAGRRAHALTIDDLVAEAFGASVEGPIDLDQILDQDRTDTRADISGEQQLTTKEIAEAAGCTVQTVRNRVRKGMTVEQIITRKTIVDASLGTKHERLTVVALDKSSGPDVVAIVDCDCGTKRKAVALKHVLTGRITSCGCAHLELLSQGKAPTHVEVFGHSVPIGVLADIAGMKPVALWSRMRRGLTAEEAAFGRVAT